MTSNGVLIDTGPLVAILSERDEHHARCVAESKQIHGPFVSTWPVITEVAYLLKSRPVAVEKLLAWVSSSKILIPDLAASDAKGIAQILARYADQSFDLADVSLMWLSERESLETIFTIDYRDFSVYRTTQGKSLTIVPAPW